MSTRGFIPGVLPLLLAALSATAMFATPVTTDDHPAKVPLDSQDGIADLIDSGPYIASGSRSVKTHSTRSTGDSAVWSTHNITGFNGATLYGLPVSTKVLRDLLLATQEDPYQNRQKTRQLSTSSIMITGFSRLL